MRTLLWLDDCRNPFEDDWLNFSPIGKNVGVIWCKNYEDFVNEITNHGLPTAICFDHDLGFTNEYYLENDLESPQVDKTGMDCAKWLVDYCMNNNLPLPAWNIQSANPVGKENIKKLLENYESFTKSSIS